MFAEYDMIDDVLKVYKTDELVLNVKKSLGANTVSAELRKAFPGREITDFKFEDRLLYVNHRMYVPQCARLKLM